MNYEKNNEESYKHKYDLFHVILHDGTIDKGHYTNCHLYKGYAWHIINDEEICPITDKHMSGIMKSQSPYLLLYKLRNELVISK